MASKLLNFLFIQVDQLAPQALSVYGHPLVRAPNIDYLAEKGVVFDSAYCNFPLCAPSRCSMLTGQLASRIGAFDNGAEFPAAIPTFLHYLRVMNYETCLSGKMHFIGPDQLHGFEERLTTDFYPSNFTITAEWGSRGPYSTANPSDPTPLGGMRAVLEAGVYKRTAQIDFDDEVTFKAVRKIYDIAREPTARPFFLLVSFVHPHDPFATTQEFWDRYDHDAIDLPAVPCIPTDRSDPHSQRIRSEFLIDQARLEEKHIRNARHAYYGSISYVDDQIGKLLRALRSTNLDRNTIVVFTSDHGEMLGERGLWFKRNFFEWSARVPLVIHAPDRFAPRRVARAVSLVDLFPTIVELASAPGRMPDLVEAVDGHSLVGLLDGKEDGWPDTVFAEHTSECTLAPGFMVRRSHYKYISCETDPAQLFDLAVDPKELNNLSGRPEVAEVERELAAEVQRRWDSEALKKEVVQSQRRHLFLNAALSMGTQAPWDFRPIVDASKQYYRGQCPYDEYFERQDIKG
jgi:choline-sulfatase